jgi:glycosyltransferase involved in cell wall biosynthesis
MSRPSDQARAEAAETAFFPIFLSVIYVFRNQAAELTDLLVEASESVAKLVTDHELIVIDNASTDDSLSVLRNLTQDSGLPNLQVYALTKEVDADTAAWVGLENALGDFVAVIDPMTEDIHFLPEMLDKAVAGTDVVFANNKQKPVQGLAYRAASFVFNAIYKFFNGVHLSNEAPQYRLLSKRVINFILQHPQPAISYRHLPATAGFTGTNLDYLAKPRRARKKNFGESFHRSLRLLVSTTQSPMRLVTSLSLFGAAANLIYSVYVVAIAVFKTNVAPGWISLSLQQSGMFFLISLVLLVLGEYILHMASLSNEGPLYHVAQEFMSARITRCEKLNIEEAAEAKSE